MTVLAHTRADLSAVLEPGPRAVIMTMGALHEGHAALMRAARDLLPEGQVVVTDFVNPTQFAAGEDFDRYPRTLEADVAICAESGVDIVFAPDVETVYGPGGATVTVDPGPRGDILEGASRPGHFRGVLTVVAKFLHMTRPSLALFGEKDYQQLVLIAAMVQALDFDVRVHGVPTVREADGLAMSSRNRYLSGEARERAAAIPRALAAGQAAASRGATAAAAEARAVLESESIDTDYVAVTDVDLDEAPSSGEARLLVAVTVDGTRLIDNCALVVGQAP